MSGAAEEGSSFGWLVVRRAWFSAWKFFESWRHDLLVFVFSTVVGLLGYSIVHGLPATWTQLMDVLVLSALPAIALWLLLFVWHLWLAPSAIVYEAHRAEQLRTPTAEVMDSGRPLPLSIEEQRFHEDCRIFVRSKLEQLVSGFSGTLHEAWNRYQGDTSADQRLSRPELQKFYDKTVRIRDLGFGRLLIELQRTVSNDPISTPLLLDQLRQFVSEYGRDKGVVKELCEMIGIKPDRAHVKSWRAAEENCAATLKDLQASSFGGGLNNLADANLRNHVW